MKLFVRLFFLFLLSANITAQCPIVTGGDLFIVDQNYIDNFPLIYPNCKILPRDVYIDGPGIINLKGLKNIERTSGYLIIRGTSLKSLEGLENLSDIYYDLDIYGNDSLVNLDALNNLKYVRSIYFSGNESLKEINTLNGVTKLVILDISSKKLKKLSGFNSVKTISSNLTLGDIPSLIYSFRI